MERRWYYVSLVAVAIAISYFDRQTLPVAITAIQKNIPLSNQQFSYLGTAFLKRPLLAADVCSLFCLINTDTLMQSLLCVTVLVPSVS